MKIAHAASFLLFLGLALATDCVVQDYNGHQFIKKVSFRGQASHGVNIFNGEPLSDFSTVISTFSNPDTIGFWGMPFAIRENGALLPGEIMGGPITHATPLDALISTWLSPEAIDAFQISDPSIFADRLHLPYLTSWSHVDGTTNYYPIPEADKDGLTGQFYPTYVKRTPVTLRDWNKATGRITLGCREDMTGYVYIHANQLIPNMIYTIWSVSASDTEDLPSPIFATMLGGSPAVVITDAQGDATFERFLEFCPLKLENPVMYISLAAQPDGVVYGSQPFSNTNPFGVSGGDQLVFTIAADVNRYVDCNT